MDNEFVLITNNGANCKLFKGFTQWEQTINYIHPSRKRSCPWEVTFKCQPCVRPEHLYVPCVFISVRL